MEIKDYKAPRAEVIEVKAQSVLCGSPLGDANSTEMEVGDDNW